MITILVAFGAVCLLLALHPFVIYPLSLSAGRKLLHGDQAETTTHAQPAGGLSFALCTCAYNEEAVIEAKVQNLLALAETIRGTHVLVYVDGCSDRTAEILGAYSDRIDLLVSDERCGKTRGMNLLVDRTDASVLVFSDANVMLDLEVLERLREHFADPLVGCVCGHLEYTNGAESVTAGTGQLYWRLEQHIKRLESAWGRVMGADGSLFALRRALHRPVPEDIIDDMYLSLSVLLSGHRVIQVDDVIAYEQSVSIPSEEFRRKIRIACQAFNVHRLLWAQLSRMDLLSLYMYISHKFLRWVSIYFMFLAAICFIAASAAAGYLELALGVAIAGAVVLAAGWRWKIRPFAQAVDVLVALTGAAIGVAQSLRGNRYRMWQPAGSVRERQVNARNISR